MLKKLLFVAVVLVLALAQGYFIYAVQHGAIDAFTGAPTASMIEYSSVLKTLTEQIVTDIICGVKSVDAFDAFVESWKLNGGDAIAAEVNAWYQAKTSN